jgi:hypothetical protein
MNDRPLTIRLASSGDAPALRHLAQLDSAAPLVGHVLLAELDGRPLAAVSLESGVAIADPFRHSADAARLLEVRRRQLLGQRSDAAPARSLLRRLVPAS